MTLTEKEKQRIAEEEEYRAKIREESQPKSKKGWSGCFIAILIILGLPIVLLAITLIAINPAKQLEKAEQNAKLSVITPFPANGFVNRTEDEIKTAYEPFYTNYSDTGLTPSGKVKITGFDIPNANVQIDYEVATSKPVYIGYSFAASPLEEDTAWAVTGVSKPTESPTSNPGIMNRTVYSWGDIPEIEPFRMLIAIYESDGKVSNISFSIEDYATAKSNNSLYYVPDR
jgi:hypothetical protein